jgi:hypothetical protein
LPAGAPFGNKNAAKSRLVEQAIIRELKQRDLEAGDGETLRKMAAAQVDKALAGDGLAFDKVADRLDGKPAQQVQLSGDENAPLKIIHESK